MEAAVRLQFSIELVPWPAMPTFQNTTRAMIPFAWIELVTNVVTIFLMISEKLIL